MKFIAEKSKLQGAIQSVIGVVPANLSLPILENVAMDLKGGNLSITATDLETTAIANIDVQGKEDGSVCIPARTFFDTLKTLSDIPISVDSNDSHHITLSAGNGVYKMVGEDIGMFPMTPKAEGEGFEIEAASLKKAIERTLFATGTDELRPVLTGVYFDGNGTLNFVSTDAHKLALIDSGVKCNDFSFIVPKKPLNIIKGWISGTVNITYNPTNAVFTNGGISVTVRLIDGKYPNYKAVIPTNNDKGMKVSRTGLLDSLRRILLYSNEATRMVRFNLDNELVVSAENLDSNKEAKESVTCDYGEGSFEIGFNAKMLIEVLSVLDSDEVMFEMSAANRAGLIKPVGVDGVAMIVMPVMLNK